MSVNTFVDGVIRLSNSILYVSMIKRCRRMVNIHETLQLKTIENPFLSSPERLRGRNGETTTNIMYSFTDRDHELP